MSPDGHVVNLYLRVGGDVNKQIAQRLSARFMEFSSFQIRDSLAGGKYTYMVEVFGSFNQRIAFGVKPRFGSKVDWD